MRSRPMTRTGSPLRRQMFTLSASLRQHWTLTNVVAPSDHSPGSLFWRRGVYAIRSFANEMSPVTVLNLGSCARYPTRHTCGSLNIWVLLVSPEERAGRALVSGAVRALTGRRLPPPSPPRALAGHRVPRVCGQPRNNPPPVDGVSGDVSVM